MSCKKKMKFGGKVELEGGEAVHIDGEGGMVEGPDHENGGVDLDLPQGTLVFSKRIKVGNKTMADREMARLRKEKKAQKAMDKQPTDPRNRFTLDRILQLNDLERQLDLEMQQNYGSSDKKAVEMKYGGKYPYGTGPMGVLGNLNRFNLKHQLAMLDQKKFNAHMRTVFQKENDMIEGYREGTDWVDGLKEGPKKDAFSADLLDRWTGAHENRQWFKATSPTLPNKPEQVQSQSGQSVFARNLANAPMRGFDGAAPISEEAYLDMNPQAFQSQPSDPVSTSPFVGMPGFDGNAPLAEPQASEYKKSPLSALGDAAKLAGPALGPAGLAVSTVAPLVTTVLNRLGDKKPVNPYEDFGRDALESNSASMRGAAASKAQSQRQIDLEGDKARNIARNSARGISTLRALDQGTAAQSMTAKTAANTQYYNNLDRLFATRSQLQNQRDQMVMQGRDLASERATQDRDNFFTNINQDLGTLGEGMMFGQRMSRTPSIWGAFDGFRIKQKQG